MRIGTLYFVVVVHINRYLGFNNFIRLILPIIVFCQHCSSSFFKLLNILLSIILKFIIQQFYCIELFLRKKSSFCSILFVVNNRLNNIDTRKINIKVRWFQSSYSKVWKKILQTNFMFSLTSHSKIKLSFKF